MRLGLPIYKQQARRRLYVLPQHHNGGKRTPLKRDMKTPAIFRTILDRNQVKAAVCDGINKWLSRRPTAHRPEKQFMSDDRRGKACAKLEDLPQTHRACRCLAMPMQLVHVPLFPLASWLAKEQLDSPALAAFVVRPQSGSQIGAGSRLGIRRPRTYSIISESCSSQGQSRRGSRSCGNRVGRRTRQRFCAAPLDAPVNDRVNNRQILEPIGNVPSAEAEQHDDASLDD